MHLKFVWGISGIPYRKGSWKNDGGYTWSNSWKNKTRETSKCNPPEIPEAERAIPTGIPDGIRDGSNSL